jgi:hypothetical protein
MSLGSEFVLASLERLRGVAHKPLLLVGGSEADRKDILDDAAAEAGDPVVNVSVVLAQYFLSDDIDTGQGLAATLVKMTEAPKQAIFLERLEILFDPILACNPVDVLCRISRVHPVCATWPGNFESSRLRYAARPHPEHFDSDASRTHIIDVNTIGTDSP